VLVFPVCTETEPCSAASHQSRCASGGEIGAPSRPISGKAAEIDAAAGLIEDIGAQHRRTFDFVCYANDQRQLFVVDIDIQKFL
jgi:hypothetical protein